MQQIFNVTLGVDYAARDTGRRITMRVRETDALSAAIKAEQEADERLEHPDVEYTHAMQVAPFISCGPAASMPLLVAA